MLKSLLKIQRIPAPLLRTKTSFFEPAVKRNLFGLFKKKKDGENLPQNQEVSHEDRIIAEAKAEAERIIEDDKFIDQKQYFEKLKKEREEYEAKIEKEKQAFEFIEQRDKREYQINVAQVDYSRVAQENINLTGVEEFKHLEELFYFISNLRVRLSEENLKKCLEGFLYLAERINSSDLDKPQYQEFIEIVKSNIMTISDNKNIHLILKFADLYIVEDTNLWKLLERKVMQKFQQYTVPDLVSMLIHFANQNEGSEQFYDQLEKVITPEVDNLEVRQLVIVAQSYYQVKRGTKQFFDLLNEKMMAKINETSPSDLIRLCIVYSAANLSNRFAAFEKIEEQIKKHLNEYNLPEICIMAESFGLENGSSEVFKLFEKIVIEKLDSLEYEQILMVLRGFAYTYRGSKDLFGALKSRLINFFPRMDLETLSAVAKAYHITQNDDKQFETILEKHVIVGLRRIDQVTPEDLFEVASSYNITRIGSRELYKILEFVLREKLDEITKKPEIARGLYYLYTTSGLCSPELIKKLQFIV